MNDEAMGLVRSILVACWEIEDGSGGWNGGDVVDIVCNVLDGAGLDISHPATREGGTGEREDYDLDDLRAFARGEGEHPQDDEEQAR